MAGKLGLVSQKLNYPSAVSVWADLGIEPLLDRFLDTQFAQDRRYRMPNTWNTSKCYQVLWLFNEGLKEKPNPLWASIDLLADPQIVKNAIRHQIINRYKSRREIALSIGNDLENEFFAGFNEVILNRRNDVVLEKLEQELAYHGSSEEILIVYGADHMPDIENRFTQKHNYVPQTERGLVAFTF